MSDPFTLLGVDKRFDLDEQALHAGYLRAIAAAHPDRFADPLEQADAADRAARLNEAYQTLADPQRRAHALLAALGGPVKENDPALPPDLLMEMMSVRERMEEAIAAADADELAALRRWADEECRRNLADLADHLAADPPDLAQARLRLNALRYVQRMIEQMPR